MPNRVIFINSDVSNYQALIEQLPADSEVVLLDAEQDGVMQIAAALQGRTDIDAIDIISHGAPGSLKLGSSILNSNNLADHTAQLSEIGKHLSDDGDILLYGCDVAQGKNGRSFVDQLAQLTGADVEASDDTTGNTFVGANWDLEVSVGSIDTSTLVQSDIEAFGQNTLATADNIFIEQGKDDGQGVGIKEAGVIRVLADFSKAAYDRQTWENPIYNDISINADVALAAVKAQGWQSLDLTIPSLTTFDTFAIRDYLDFLGTTEHSSTNKMQGGFYTHHNAAAFVARSDDAIVISFRGTNRHTQCRTSDDQYGYCGDLTLLGQRLRL